MLIWSVTEKKGNMLKFPKKTIHDVDVRNKIVLVRTDYNVPIENGKVISDSRITVSLPTLRYLADRGARIVIISHLGRPKGKIDAKYSLEPVADRLQELWPNQVKFVNDCIGDKVKTQARTLRPGGILLLENLRFHPGEESDNREFAKNIVKSSGASLFVQDGFGAVHRAHASTSAITEYVPSVAGLLLEHEWTTIKGVISDPNRPLTAIIGGAKIADKLPLINKLIDISDTVIVGGALANNFLMADGFPVGASLWDLDMNDEVAKIIAKAKKKYGVNFKQNFILPVDVAISKNGSTDGARYNVVRSKVTPNSQIFDVGTKTINRIAEAIERSGTVIWNGTLGLAEKPNFAHGSSRVALSLANNPQIYSLVCGGDTASFAQEWDILNGASFSYLSSGGGASLNLIAGQPLPGIDSLLS